MTISCKNTSNRQPLFIDIHKYGSSQSNVPLLPISAWMINFARIDSVKNEFQKSIAWNSMVHFIIYCIILSVLFTIFGSNQMSPIPFMNRYR